MSDPAVAFEVPAMDDSELFFVRVWPTHSRFRASVRAVDDEQSLLFTEPEQLTAFFVQRHHEPHQPVETVAPTGEDRER